MKKTALTFALLIAAAAVPAGAQVTTLAEWTFESSVPTTAGPLSPEVGSGSATGFHVNASTWSNPVGNGSNESWSSTNWSVNDFLQFQVDSTGYEGLFVSWDQTSSNTGPRDFSLSFSTNGVNFTHVDNYVVLANNTPNPAWSSSTAQPAFSFLYELSDYTELDNDSSIFFRLTNTSTMSANGGTVASGGTGRVDNFLVQGAVIPEPSAFAALAGLLTLGFAAWRRGSAA